MVNQNYGIKNIYEMTHINFHMKRSYESCECHTNGPPFIANDSRSENSIFIMPKL